MTTQDDLTQFEITIPVAGYWRVVFSNPPINMLNSTTVVQLDELVHRIVEAEDLKVVVFASCNPEFYMARYDLSDVSPIAFAPTESGVTLFIDSMLRMNEAAPITIASIRGRARGGGSEFVLACDIRFASLENCILGQPEVGVGILPGGGAIERLSDLVGFARALEIVASAEDYDASTAERYGWINRAVPDEELDHFVDELARRIAMFDSEALAAAKRQARRHSHNSVEDYRGTLQLLRPLLTRPASGVRREAVKQYALSVGPDFELSMGHHLGLIGRAPGS